MLDFVINLVSKLYTVLLLPHGTHARIDVDLILRGIFGFYYVPIVLYVLLVGANVALQFAYVTLLPTVQDLPLLNFAHHLQNKNNDILLNNNNNNNLYTQDENSFVNSWKASFFDAVISSTSSVFSQDDNNNNINNNFAKEDQQREILRKKQLLDMIFTHLYFWISEVFTALIPHATFFFCLMGVMNKIVTASGEAAVDTISYYRGLDYPLLFATVKVSVLAGWKRQALTFAVGSTILYAVWRFASEFILNLILTRPISVIAAVFSNVMWCFVYLLSTFISAFSENRRRESRRKQRLLAGGTSSRSATDNDDEEQEQKQASSSENEKNQQKFVIKRKKPKTDYSSLPFWNELQWLQSRFGFDSTWSVAAAAATAASTHQRSNVASAAGAPRSQPEELANFFASTTRSSSSSSRSTNNNNINNSPTSFASRNNSQSSPSLLSSHWVSEWWRSHVNFIRHISLSFLLVFVVFWTLTDGPIAAFSFAVEALIVLNIPNFCIYLTLKIVVAMIRGWYGFQWMLRHYKEGWIWVVLLVSFPYLAFIVYTASFVSSTTIPTVTLTWAGIQVVARSVLLCREHDVSGDHIVWSTILTHHHLPPTQHNNNNNNNRKKSSPISPLEKEQNQTQTKKPNDEDDGTISPSVQDTLYFHQFNSNNSKTVKTEPPKLDLLSPSSNLSDENSEESMTFQPQQTKRRLAPAVAALLENAYECASETTTETISLEMEADLFNMKLFKRGLIMDLVREDLTNSASSSSSSSSSSSLNSSSDDENEAENAKKNTETENSEKFLHKKIPILATTIQLLPRLFLFQSSPSFSGPRFQFVRTVLRFLTGSFVAIFIMLVVSLVAQESMEILRPLPMKINCLDTKQNINNNNKNNSFTETICNDLEVDHLVVKLRLQLKSSQEQNAIDEEENANPDNNDNVDQNHHHPHKKSRSEMHEFAAVSAESSGGPICDIEANKDDNHHQSVHLWELSWLALIPYLANIESANMLLATLNRALDTDWEILPFYELQQQPQPQSQPGSKENIITSNNQNTVPPQLRPVHGLSRQARQPWRSFMRFRSPTRSVTVVSIRGTDMTSVLDALQDVDMFLESFVFHTLSHLVPGLRMLPGQIVRDLIRLSSEAWPQDGIACIDRACERDAAVRAERRYYDIVLRFLNDDAEYFEKKFPNDKLLVVGHSQAGSTANVVAARFPKAHRSFGFSSPGVELSMYKFGITSPEAVRRKATTIISDNDIVPMIGGQIGMQVPLACFDSIKERCHSMESIVNSIWQVCKDETLKKRFPKVKDLSII